MSKISENFFSFPIKIYDGFSLKRAMKEEDESEDIDGPIAVDWVSGHVKIPASEVLKLLWHDGFSRERTVKQAAEEGFDLTMVFAPNYGEFVCLWARDKFEERVEKFLAALEEKK